MRDEWNIKPLYSFPAPNKADWLSVCGDMPGTAVPG